MSTLLANADLYAPEPLGPGSVLIENGKIAQIFTGDELLPEADDRIDVQGAALGPGFIDVHTHGGEGADFMTDTEAVHRMSGFFARHGVTGFLPTTVTASLEETHRVLDRLAGVDVPAARVLGVHLEGPFISAERLGAQSGAHRIDPDPESVNALVNATEKFPARLITMAPELPHGIDTVRRLADAGFVVSMGHTGADARVALQAIEAGASHLTHAFNAMPSFHHRDPGIIGVAFTHPEVMIELIVDGIHVDPVAVNLALAAKGIDSVILITDSIAAAGAEDGRYRLGPVDVIVEDGSPRLESGVLAGSTLTMDRAVWNVAQWTDAGLSGAWRMASTNPAKQFGLDSKGSMASGYDADLTAMDPGSGETVLTLVAGQTVHQCSP